MSTRRLQLVEDRYWLTSAGWKAAYLAQQRDAGSPLTVPIVGPPCSLTVWRPGTPGARGDTRVDPVPCGDPSASGSRYCERHTGDAVRLGAEWRTT